MASLLGTAWHSLAWHSAAGMAPPSLSSLLIMAQHSMAQHIPAGKALLSPDSWHGTALA